MITMDIFNDDAFSATSLAAAVDKIGYVPSLLDGMTGLFDPVPVRTEEIWIESRENEAALIQTSARGSDIGENSNNDKREARPFKTKRLFDHSRIRASELFGIRAFGSETELKAVQDEVAYRQSQLKRKFALTRENLKLGCVQGLVKDADGSTIYDWEAQFGQTIPAEVDFDLDNASPASGIIRQKCATAVRSITRGLKQEAQPSAIVGLAGDTFWDQLIAHPEVRQTYLNYAAAADLRGPTVWQQITYGGINFINYRSTDNDAKTKSQVGIDTLKCKFFPTGAGIFKWAMSPGESFSDIGTMGQDFYSRIILDQKRDQWADIEMYSYILPVCTMPQALYRAKNT